MSAKRPVFYQAIKSGRKFLAAAETVFGGAMPFGFVESDIPEQPQTMQELVDLRQRGYIIESLGATSHVKS